MGGRGGPSDLLLENDLRTAGDRPNRTEPSSIRRPADRRALSPIPRPSAASHDRRGRRVYYLTTCVASPHPRPAPAEPAAGHPKCICNSGTSALVSGLGSPAAAILNARTPSSVTLRNN